MIQARHVLGIAGKAGEGRQQAGTEDSTRGLHLEESRLSCLVARSHNMTWFNEVNSSQKQSPSNA